MSQANKIYCDICGREIKYVRGYKTYYSDGSITYTPDKDTHFYKVKIPKVYKYHRNDLFDEWNPGDKELDICSECMDFIMKSCQESIKYLHGGKK